MEVYLQISWKSDKVVIVNRSNLNTYISNYRCGLWNLFLNFIDDIESVSVEIKGIAQTMIDALTETTSSCTAYKNEWEEVFRAVDEWEQNPYDMPLRHVSTVYNSFFI
jgi:hypothetical protein